MEKLIEFIGNNYVWFLTITIILLFALIGYIYDNRKPKIEIKEEEKIKDEEEKGEEIVNEEPIKLESTELNNNDINDDIDL